jgi:hypothetical protein
MRQELETARLRLRRWRPDDLETVAAWNFAPWREVDEAVFGLRLIVHALDRG